MEKPILFSGPMVRAILEGRKTQTRRVLKHQPILCTELPFLLFPQSKTEAIEQTGFIWPNAKAQILGLCPYGQPGDQLWVREMFADLIRSGIEHRPTPSSPIQRFAYAADIQPGSYADECRKDYGIKWTPSIHMPRLACRILLKITEVRVEKLQDISEKDAESEGVPAHETARAAYANLWNELNGADSWAANPWVWVISFEVVKHG